MTTTKTAVAGISLGVGAFVVVVFGMLLCFCCMCCMLLLLPFATVPGPTDYPYLTATPTPYDQGGTPTPPESGQAQPLPVPDSGQFLWENFAEQGEDYRRSVIREQDTIVVRFTELVASGACTAYLTDNAHLAQNRGQRISCYSYAVSDGRVYSLESRSGQSLFVVYDTDRERTQTYTIGSEAFYSGLTFDRGSVYFVSYECPFPQGPQACLTGINLQEDQIFRVRLQDVAYLPGARGLYELPVVSPSGEFIAVPLINHERNRAGATIVSSEGLIVREYTYDLSLLSADISEGLNVEWIDVHSLRIIAEDGQTVSTINF